MQGTSIVPNKDCCSCLNKLCKACDKLADTQKFKLFYKKEYKKRYGK